MQLEIQKTLEVLKSGGIILYPTDTIWGIGCDATNKAAVDKIFKIKKREEEKSMIILIENEQMLHKYVKDVPPVAYELLDHAEKPLTIIYQHATKLPPNLMNKDGSIGIRIVKDTFCKKVINKLNSPLVSTSANLSGKPSPANFKQIDPVILESVDYVVNLRKNELQKVKASTIMSISYNGEFKIIRK
jgi:L-threonylcarbamoyladenylate synthase